MKKVPMRSCVVTGEKLEKRELIRVVRDKDGNVFVDESGKAIDVTLRNRGVGENLIEDFMIAANETVATHIYYMELPFVYRVHGEPNEEKIQNSLSDILKNTMSRIYYRETEGFEEVFGA